MRTRLVVLAFTLLVSPLSGCATAGTTTNAPPGVEVRASNRNRADATVFAMRSGHRTRLGTVPSGQNRTFRVPNVQPGTASRLTLRAELIGSDGAWETPVIAIVPEHRVTFTIEDLISTSSVQVEPN